MCSSKTAEEKQENIIKLNVSPTKNTLYDYTQVRIIHG